MAQVSAKVPDKFNVLLIGGGGREHAIALALKKSPRLAALYTSHPENPGLAAVAMPVDVPISIREIYRLQQFMEKKAINLVVIGPEDPLAEGFTDKLASSTCLVFGPTKDGAQLEADKAWCKQLLRSASVPTGEGRVFSDPEAARGYLESRCVDDPALAALLTRADEHPDPQDRRKFIEREVWQKKELAAAYEKPRPSLPVIKATGLAKGKGVILPATLKEALQAIEEIMVRRVFGDAGRQVLIEEKLTGAEVSVLAITDGSSILMLPPAQDHKRLGDGDTGPNTGGMGAFCPADTLDEKTMRTVERDVLVPTLDALRRDGIDYKGVLYAGLMLTHAGPKVLEFNCRFGDPECQAILSRLDSDLLELIIASCTGTLAECEVRWKSDAACTVVIAAEGYPEKPKTGVPIHGLEDAARVPGVTIYHAGTKRDAVGHIVTGGGRVLAVTGLGKDVNDARAKAYEACSKISFPGMVMRSDIGGR
ncbi:MAG TPA: phosphoribosylamine--glycine ligase [Phycisphaerales bacterium]|nr:phosphoribosylamine--glycine ligase [Phycisphaerales bacterium]